MRKITYLKLGIANAIALLTIQSWAEVVINTPHGQYFCEGPGACTAIDISAAVQLLGMTPEEWQAIDVEKLEKFVRTGIDHYREILAKQHYHPGYHLQASQVIPSFPILEQIKILDIVSTISPEARAEWEAAGIPVVTVDSLAEAIQNVKAPVCGVWTYNNESQLICFKNNLWLFLDSHRQSNGEGGASMHLFESTANFQQFLNTYRVFNIAPEAQANVTLVRLKPTAASPATAVAPVVSAPSSIPTAPAPTAPTTKSTQEQLTKINAEYARVNAKLARDPVLRKNQNELAITNKKLAGMLKTKLDQEKKLKATKNIVKKTGLQKEIQKFNRQIKVLQQRAAQLNKDIAAQMAALFTLKAEKQRLEQQSIKEKIVQHKARIRKLGKKLESFKKQTTTLEKQIKNLIAKKTTAKKALANKRLSKTQKASKQKDLAKLEHQLKPLQQKMAMLRKQINEIQPQLLQEQAELRNAEKLLALTHKK